MVESTIYLYAITSRIRSKKGAEFGIAGLVSVADIATANNTISIVMTGPLAKEIADEYEIDPRKSASILDIFSCAIQGIVPYGRTIACRFRDCVYHHLQSCHIHFTQCSSLCLVYCRLLFAFPRLQRQPELSIAATQDVIKEDLHLILEDREKVDRGIR